MAMRYEFVSGSIIRPAKRAPYWPKLKERESPTFCDAPSSYVDCEGFKVRPGSRGSDIGSDSDYV